MEHGLHGAHPTRAKVKLVCEQLTVIIVLLLADEKQGEPDCINPNGLEVMYLPAFVGGKPEIASNDGH
jgi:hypothetical protein